MSQHAHAHDHHPSAKPYVLTLAALLVLTVVTVGAAYIDFGPLSVIIAIAIATVKASLVALFFMHLRHDSPVNAMIFVSSLIFLGLFLWFPYMDIHSRDKVVPNGLRMTPQMQQQKAPAAPAPAAGHGAAH